MKAKKVYEFIQKKSLKNSIDIGIKYKIKEEINKWCKEFIPNITYEINDKNFKLTIYDSVNLSFEEREIIFPTEMVDIYGALDLSYSNLKKLPSKYLRVEQHLALTNTKIKKLPDELLVGSNININNVPISELPNNINRITGHLYAKNTKLTKLPDNLKEIHGFLLLDKTPITKLPDKLQIKDWLSLSESKIETLSNNIKIGGSLFLTKCKNITELYNLNNLKGNLDIQYSSINYIQDNLKVEQVVELSNSNIIKIPEFLSTTILYIKNTKITEIPETINIYGSIYIDKQMFNKIKIPSKFKNQIIIE